MVAGPCGALAGCCQSLSDQASKDSCEQQRQQAVQVQDQGARASQRSTATWPRGGAQVLKEAQVGKADRAAQVRVALVAQVARAVRRALAAPALGVRRASVDRALAGPRAKAGRRVSADRPGSAARASAGRPARAARPALEARRASADRVVAAAARRPRATKPTA